MSILWTAIILGIIQGLTEFLPVSSSGHLVIAQHLLHVENIQLILSVAVHFGTILAVFVFFRTEIFELFAGFFVGLKTIPQKGFKTVYQELTTFRIALIIGVATIPAGIAGLTFKDFLETSFSSISTAGIMLLITALFLFITRLAPESKIDKEQFSLPLALIIGIVQAIALLPGISRSGITISAALLLGIKREWAAKFSFLLSIPAIVGASLLESLELTGLSASELNAVIISVITAALVGYLSLFFLMKMVVQGKFYYFSFYCLPLGCFALYLGMFY